MKSKWKVFAMRQVLADHSPAIETEALFDMILNSDDDELVKVFDDHAVLVWRPFEDMTLDDIACTIVEMATRAEEVEEAQ